MKEFLFTSDVKENNLQMNVRRSIAEKLPYFNGKRVEIIIRKLSSKRSIQQNRYYWAACTIIANEIGLSKEEVHDILKFKFLQEERVIEATGEIVICFKSTAKLNKSDFADFMDSVIRWAAEMNIYIPSPDEQLTIM